MKKQEFKFKKFAALTALVVVCGFVMGQGKQPSYTVKEGIAEWTAPDGVDLDRLWAATLKTLMVMRWSTLSVDKPSGKINARQAHGTFMTFGKDPEDMPKAELVFMADNGKLSLLVRWYVVEGGQINFGWSSTKKKFYKNFFTKLEEALK